MSRIGKKPILIPDGIEVKIENNIVTVKGPKGELKKEIRPEIRVEIRDKNIFVFPCKDTKKTSAFWGLFRVYIFNMIKGVTQGYQKDLQLEGIGFRARMEGDKLILQLGFSHEVNIIQPSGIKIAVEKNIIKITGFDKELVGQTAAKIRAIKPPEPYKGKGIRYVGEVVKKKAGKKVVAAAS